MAGPWQSAVPVFSAFFCSSCAFHLMSFPRIETIPLLFCHLTLLLVVRKIPFVCALAFSCYYAGFSDGLYYSFFKQILKGCFCAVSVLGVFLIIPGTALHVTFQHSCIASFGWLFPAAVPFLLPNSCPPKISDLLSCVLADLSQLHCFRSFLLAPV